jgi:hypothetical protein
MPGTRDAVRREPMFPCLHVGQDKAAPRTTWEMTVSEDLAAIGMPEWMVAKFGDTPEFRAIRRPPGVFDV